LGVRVKGERRDISSLRKKLRESLTRWQKSITSVSTAFDRDARLMAIHFIDNVPHRVGDGGRSTPIPSD
jgi:hypothetical protein